MNALHDQDLGSVHAEASTQHSSTGAGREYILAPLVGRRTKTPLASHLAAGPAARHCHRRTICGVPSRSRALQLDVQARHVDPPTALDRLRFVG